MLIIQVARILLLCLLAIVSECVIASVFGGIQGKEVEYSLRAIPLGGYVAFPDDDPTSAFKPDDPDLLRNRGILSRAMVISAGVIANLIFAYAVLFAQVRKRAFDHDYGRVRETAEVQERQEMH